jgi:hypothetical protein
MYLSGLRFISHFISATQQTLNYTPAFLTNLRISQGAKHMHSNLIFREIKKII